MSLLNDVSIVVTPNGYKAGELYAVVPVPTEGAEEITNGDFATDSDWTKGTGWSISGGTANCIGGAGSLNLTQVALEIGKRYTVTYTVSNYSTGTIHPIIGGWTHGTYQSSNGTYTEVISNNHASANTTFYMQGKSGFVGSIDNVSVKEYTSADMDVTRATDATRVDENGLVNYAEILGDEEVTNGNFATDSDWDKTGTWSIESNYATSNANGLTQYLGQDVGIVNGRTYKITYTVLSNSLNNDRLLMSGTSSFTTTQIPSSIGQNTVYLTASQTPSSGYDVRFANSATNTSGIITLDNVSVKQLTRDNVPRIDYTGGGCPHILAEPQRTNLLKYSEDFSQWAAEESSVSLNTLETLSPDGGNNATILTENTSFGKHGVVVNTTSGGSSYSFSFFAKYKTRQFISIVTSDDVYWQSQVVVNLIDGSITKEFSRSYTITNKVEDFGNGWYKISASINGTYNTRFYSRIYLSNVAVPSDPPNNFYTGESLSAYIWAAQLEVGSYPTSYIPTSGSTVTRNQDIFTRDGIGSLINDSEGVLFAEISRTEDESNYRLLGLDNGTSQNYIKIGFGNNNGNFWILAVVNGVTVINSTNAVSNNANQFYKIAVRYKSGDSVIYIDGVPVLTSSTTFSSGTFTDLDFTHFTGSSHFFGKVKQLQVYNTALTDEQLTSLTS